MTLKSNVLHGGNLPPFVNLYGQNACNTPKRRLHLVTVEIHGNKATLQAVVMRNYINLVDALKAKDIIIGPISTYRSCALQRKVCDGICGHGCSGCPGLCAPCGTSAHQSGAGIDTHLYSHKDRTYAQAYKVYLAEAKKQNLHNFSSTSDPWHLSFAEAH